MKSYVENELKFLLNTLEMAQKQSHFILTYDCLKDKLTKKAETDDVPVHTISNILIDYKIFLDEPIDVKFFCDVDADNYVTSSNPTKIFKTNNVVRKKASIWTIDIFIPKTKFLLCFVVGEKVKLNPILNNTRIKDLITKYNLELI
jgi:hypothetical protein